MRIEECRASQQSLDITDVQQKIGIVNGSGSNPCQANFFCLYQKKTDLSSKGETSFTPVGIGVGLRLKVSGAWAPTEPCCVCEVFQEDQEDL